MSRNAPDKANAPADYLKLVARFPIRPLTSETDYEAAWAVVEPLVGRSNLTDGEEMYLDAVSYFLEQYEEKNHPVGQSLTPIELLKEMMEQHDMNVTGLGKVIGSQPMASMILRGERGISKANITRLAAYFHVDPSLFIERAISPAPKGKRRGRAAAAK